tara:strand:- start:445 stop:897 length:453 start_codon:yes stop_codon:yes gene_type:complete
VSDFEDSTEFFELLYNDVRFCDGLGKVMLAAGKLERTLQSYLSSKGIEPKNKRATLGVLVRLLKESGLLTSNGKMHFDDLLLKRNYLAHSLYDLFSGNIEQSILPRENLEESDVEIFADRAHGFAGDLQHFIRLVDTRIDIASEKHEVLL